METETYSEGRKEDKIGFAGESVTLTLQREISMEFLSAREYCTAAVCYIGIVVLVNTHYTASDEFQPLFLKVKGSAYCEHYSFMTGLTQDTMLGFDLNDLEIRHDVQDDMVRDPSPGGKICSENPCHFGFHIWGICEGGI